MLRFHISLSLLIFRYYYFPIHEGDVPYMKRICLFALCFCCGLVAWITCDYLNQADEYLCLPNLSTAIRITVSPENLEHPMDRLISICQQEDTALLRVEYDYADHSMTAYTTDMTDYARWLEEGRLPNHPDEFLSTNPMEDPAQSGTLAHFDPQTEISIFSFAQYQPSIEVGRYYLATDDAATVDKIIAEIYAIDHGRGYQAIPLEVLEWNEYALLFSVIYNYRNLILFAVLLISFLGGYLCFARLRTRIIQKSLGYGNGRLILSPFFEFFLPGGIAVYFVIFVIATVALSFYNHLSRWMQFGFLYTIGSLLLIAVAYSVIFFLHACFVVQIKPIGLLKGQLPFASAIVLTYLYKAVIVILLVPTILSLSQLSALNHQFYQLEARFEVLKGYVELPVHSERIVTDEEMYLLELQYKRLFEIENNLGGILIEPSGYLSRSDAEDQEFSDPEAAFFAVNNTVLVNHGYLKNNPIYDINGEQVAFENEYEDTIHVLMPEQYRPYEETFVRDLTEYANFTYYASEDIYLNSGETGSQAHTDRTITITYVRDDQYYFTYNPDVARSQNCYLKDPIALVVNNVNFGGDTYLAVFSSGSFKIEVPPEEQNLAYFQDAVEACGLDDSVLSVQNSYEVASDSIHHVLSLLFQRGVIGAAYGVALVILNVISIFILQITYQKRLWIQQILGYSLLRGQSIYIASTVVFWIFVLGILLLFFEQNVFDTIILSCIGLAGEILLGIVIAFVRSIRQPGLSQSMEATRS